MYLFRIDKKSSAPSLWFKKKNGKKKKLASIMFYFDFVLFFIFLMMYVCVWLSMRVSVRLSVINTVYLVFSKMEKSKMSLFDFFSSSTL